jgi:hypothetical protein
VAGFWKTIGDETKQPKALVRITERDGVLSGRIERLFDPSQLERGADPRSEQRQGLSRPREAGRRRAQTWE